MQGGTDGVDQVNGIATPGQHFYFTPGKSALVTIKLISMPVIYSPINLIQLNN